MVNNYAGQRRDMKVQQVSETEHWERAKKSLPVQHNPSFQPKDVLAKSSGFVRFS